MKKKSIALFLAFALVVGAAIGGTLAWLTADSGPVLNTFTTSDINITLSETKGNVTGTSREFKMVPGYTIEKDPKVTVATGGEKCYVFVKLEELHDFDAFLTYSIADGWYQLKDDLNQDIPGVFYRIVGTDDMGTPLSVLKADQVTVKSTVTKSDMNNLTTTTYPQLKVTAYASQYMKNSTENFTATEAWENVNPSSTTN